jgi:tetratricopeptide (TPR) repeat protein
MKLFLRAGLGAVCATGLFLAGCSSMSTRSSGTAGDAAHTQREDATENDGLSEEERVEAYSRFSTGYAHELSGQADKAYQDYLKSVEADPGNEALAIDVARHLLQTQHADSAAKLLNLTIQRVDADGLVYSWYSRACSATGRTNDAIAAAETAIKKSPGEFEGYAALFDLYHAQGKDDLALKTLDRAESFSDAGGLFLLELADSYQRWLKATPGDARKITPKIVALLKRAATKDIDDPDMRLRLADALLAHNETDAASGLYLELLEDFDDNQAVRDSIRQKLAAIYLRSSDRKKAAVQLEAMVRDNPTRYPQAYLFLGSMAYEDKDYERAEGYFTKVILISPDIEQAYYELAALKITVDKPSQAIETLEKARARFADNFILEFYSALAFTKAKDFAQAVKCFNTAEIVGAASDSSRLNAAFYFQYGAACERNKQYPEAEKLFRKSLERDPNSAECMNYLGYMWADRNEKLDEAFTMIDRAVKLEPKNGAYLDSLGWVLYRLKRYDEALKWELEAVVHTEEQDASLYDHLGDIYMALKNREKAVEAWKKSLGIESAEDVKKKLEGALRNQSS